MFKLAHFNQYHIYNGEDNISDIVLQDAVQKDSYILIYFITDFFIMILLWLFETKNQLIGNVYIFLCYRKKNIFGTNVYHHYHGNPRYIAVQDLNEEKSAMSWRPMHLTRHHNHEPSPSEKEEFLQKLRKININIWAKKQQRF